MTRSISSDHALIEGGGLTMIITVSKKCRTSISKVRLSFPLTPPITHLFIAP